MTETSTFEIYYSGNTAVYVFATMREAIASFETKFPEERWSYAKNIISGSTLGYDDYHRIIDFEVAAEPRRKSMADGLKWIATRAPEARPANPVSPKVKEVKPYQGSLF